MSFFSALKLFFQNDLRLELRRRETLVSVLYFAFLVTVISSFAVAGGGVSGRQIFAPLFYLVLLFTVTLYLNRSFEAERESHLVQMLRLLDYSKAGLYCGKLASHLFFLAFIMGLQLAAFNLLLDLRLGFSLLSIYLVCLLALLGLLGSGLLFSTMMVDAKFRELLLPLMLFPVNLPLLFAALRLSENTLAGASLFSGPWFSLLAGFDLILLILGLIFFELVLQGGHD